MLIWKEYSIIHMDIDFHSVLFYLKKELRRLYKNKTVYVIVYSQIVWKKNTSGEVIPCLYKFSSMGKL